jgi:hypothetical protein
MQHLKYDLGQLPQGATVTVTLDHRANVRLLDQHNYDQFRRNLAHRFVGGEAIKSPCCLQTPTAGHWVLVVDLGGRSGGINASVTVSE